MIGSRLLHYEITDRLGEGGMGEVYRAQDTKLDRDVAIKMLPAEFVEDAERLARFEREAKVLASLNHPHIAAIHAPSNQPMLGSPWRAPRRGQAPPLQPPRRTSWSWNWSRVRICQSNLRMAQ